MIWSAARFLCDEHSLLPDGRCDRAGRAGDRYESKTRTFSQVSLFSARNLSCRGCAWYLSRAALLTKTRCSDTSKSWSLNGPFRSPASVPTAKETVPSWPVKKELARGGQPGPICPGAILELEVDHVGHLRTLVAAGRPDTERAGQRRLPTTASKPPKIERVRES